MRRGAPPSAEVKTREAAREQASIAQAELFMRELGQFFGEQGGWTGIHAEFTDKGKTFRLKYEMGGKAEQLIQRARNKFDPSEHPAVLQAIVALIREAENSRYRTDEASGKTWITHDINVGILDKRCLGIWRNARNAQAAEIEELAAIAEVEVALRRPKEFGSW